MVTRGGIVSCSRPGGQGGGEHCSCVGKPPASPGVSRVVNLTAREWRSDGAMDDVLPPSRDDALTVLFHMHWASLVRLARLLVDDVETAEDVVQEAFAQLYRRWGSLRDPQRAHFYLRAAVANGSRNYLRGRRVRRLHVLDQPMPMVSAENEVMDGEEHRAVLAHLKELPWRQRQVLVMRYYLDFSEAQIADALGISAGAVKSHASRGIATLGRRIEAAS
jgi:RNA polymerase sigma-70 factor (sigma-E family)